METLTEEQRLREAEGLNVNATPWTGQQASSWGRTNSGSSLPQGVPSWQPGQSHGYGGYGSYRESPHSPTDDGHASFGGASSRDSRPMCKYFAMGGCTRSDCPFSHDLTVEATSTHEAANGFVLSGNVANIRNARTNATQQREALMQRQLSREDEFQQWGSSVGSPYGDDGRHAVGFMGVNTGNDSQMMSMLLGTAPQAGGASTFDLPGHHRPMEFTPYPAPSTHNQYQQGSVGRHGGFHPDDYLPPSELASRFASNNNNSVAALFGSPPTSSGSPLAGGNSNGTSPSLGSAAPPFTAYPPRGKDSEEGHAAMISSSMGRSGFDPLTSPSLLPALPSAGVTAPVTANSAAMEKTHSSAASAGSSDRITPGSVAASITPSADLFPPLPSTPGQKNSEVSAPAAPPTVIPAQTYAMKAMTGRSATPPSEPPVNDALRVPKMPVSIDDEMSAFQSMALRQPEQPKEDVGSSSQAHGRGEAQERHHQTGDRKGGNQTHGKGQHDGGRHHQRAGKNAARRGVDSHAPANAPVPL